MKFEYKRLNSSGDRPDMIWTHGQDRWTLIPINPPPPPPQTKRYNNTSSRMVPDSWKAKRSESATQVVCWCCQPHHLTSPRALPLVSLSPLRVLSVCPVRLLSSWIAERKQWQNVHYYARQVANSVLKWTQWQERNLQKDFFFLKSELLY